MTDWDPCLFVALGASPVEAWLDELLENPAAIHKAADRLVVELANTSASSLPSPETESLKTESPTNESPVVTSPVVAPLNAKRSPWLRVGRMARQAAARERESVQPVCPNDTEA